MEEQTLLSAGVDIGTTTTQVVFSRLTVRTSGGFGSVPRAEIAGREVFFQSPVWPTPLRSPEEIDAAGAAGLVRRAYDMAGLTPGDIDSGALIVTGESAGKRNAPEVSRALARWCGDFVSVAAGPDLESVLAGRGAGADLLSRRTGKSTLHVDIGGGTANLCLFEDGRETDTGCYDIGGCLIRLDGDRIVRVSPALTPLQRALSLPLAPGSVLRPEDAETLADALADLLAQAANLAPRTPLADAFVTNHPLSTALPPDQITFSGGVAECMSHPDWAPFRFGDLGVLLGRAVARHPLLSARRADTGTSPLRATVIGAGTQALEVSGSTITRSHCALPMKNLPVLFAECAEEADLPRVNRDLERELSRLREGGWDGGFAVALRGAPCPGFSFVEALAETLASFWRRRGDPRLPLVVAVEHDFAKALGQALRRRLGRQAPILCIDGIVCRGGDYLDIGTPVAGGAAVPVVVKTLIYSPEKEGSP